MLHLSLIVFVNQELALGLVSLLYDVPHEFDIKVDL
jgi:hypothetical protein